MCLTITAGVVLGLFVHYAASIAVGVVYFLILGGFVLWSKKRTNTLIKHSHFCLAYFLHVENLRHYKHQNILL